MTKFQHFSASPFFNVKVFRWTGLMYINGPLPVIDWSQRRHCDSAKLAISAKIKAIDNIQNLILTAGVHQRKSKIKEDATLIHKQNTFGRLNFPSSTLKQNWEAGFDLRDFFKGNSGASITFKTGGRGGGQVVMWRATAARRRLLFCQIIWGGQLPPPLYWSPWIIIILCSPEPVEGLKIWVEGVN